MEDKLREAIREQLGFNQVDGTYIFYLTRVKTAFGLGTMTLDDFTEIDETLVDDLIEVILPICEGGIDNV